LVYFGRVAAESVPVSLLDLAHLSAADGARMLAPKLKAMADERRLELLLLLAERPRTVKELQEATGLGQTLVSHHLGLLRQHGLVSAAAQGRSNLYSLCCEELGEPVRVLAELIALQAPAVEEAVLRPQ
jgi:DNA-binding transcriptional ArsR family regulator